MLRILLARVEALFDVVDELSSSESESAFIKEKKLPLFLRNIRRFLNLLNFRSITIRKMLQYVYLCSF